MFVLKLFDNSTISPKMQAKGDNTEVDVRSGSLAERHSSGWEIDHEPKVGRRCTAEGRGGGKESSGMRKRGCEWRMRERENIIWGGGDGGAVYEGFPSTSDRSSLDYITCGRVATMLRMHRGAWICDSDAIFFFVARRRHYSGNFVTRVFLRMMKNILHVVDAFVLCEVLGRLFVID